ncbi:uncharacterized protein BKCO1_3700033 [Diplodia corticola]|uniref:DUF7730 domain-containing protein n=1 Tax=Diplodia corticola TaxID=236234 RepID=A0A1J9QUM9_9PEZI|nr:uncharacterized protein BKCO1_3700033 [Diplodia corticola]OJD32678.1 hypothetical protein BKCO1_3700033 [Diplodia corticola]
MARRRRRKAQAEKKASGEEMGGSTEDQLEATPWPSTIYTKEELEPYKKFPVLYGERKFAREFPKEKQTLSFTDDLPAELRLMVYERVPLHVSGGFLELWSPAIWHHEARWRWRDWAALSTPLKNTFWQYASKRRALSLMRLCKKMYGEVAHMFYTKQNFRFTNLDGVLMLGAWLHTINAAHFRYLRHVTVHAALHYRGDGSIADSGQWNAFQQLVARRGMKFPCFKYRRTPKYYDAGKVGHESTVNRVVSILKSLPDLRRLEVLFEWDSPFIGFNDRRMVDCYLGYPEQLEPAAAVRHVVEDHCRDPTWWPLLAGIKREAVSPDLKMALVLLYGPNDVSTYELASPYVDEKMRAGRWLGAYAKIMGYDFGHARWEKGAYQVRYDANELLARREIKEDEEGPFLPEPPEVQHGVYAQAAKPGGSITDCHAFVEEERRRTRQNWWWWW